MFAIALFALVTVGFALGTHFRPVSSHARIAGICGGLAGVLFSMALLPCFLRSLVSDLLTCCGTVWMGIAIRSAKISWHEYDDRRMVLRAEAYQARVDAERAAQAG